MEKLTQSSDGSDILKVFERFFEEAVSTLNMLSNTQSHLLKCLLLLDSYLTLILMPSDTSFAFWNSHTKVIFLRFFLSIDTIIESYLIDYYFSDSEFFCSRHKQTFIEVWREFRQFAKIVYHRPWQKKFDFASYLVICMFLS